MGILDMILGAFLAYGLFRGLKNGLFVEVASVAALILAVYGAIHFSYLTADALGGHLDWDPAHLKIAAFALTFIGILVGVALLGKFLTRVADIAMLGLLNRLAGGVFGLVKVALILGALVIYLERAGLPLEGMAPETFENSVLYPPLKETGAFVFSRVLEPQLLE